MGFVNQYLEGIKTKKRQLRRNISILTALSFLVILAVSWNLRLTGVTIANGATCAIEEHQHSEMCQDELGTLTCTLEEHIHQLICFADLSADIETAEQWEKTIPELTGTSSEDLVLVALSQVGTSESELNYQIADDGETKQGVTRYGQWYGNAYGEWATMFTSFCLHYAGIEDVTLHSGAEAMRIAWQEGDIYRPKENYEPFAGDIIFLDKSGNGTANATAVITANDGTTLTVIEGDVDNQVAEVTYELSDTAIMGYGLTTPKTQILLSSQAPSDAVQNAGQNERAPINYTVWLDGTLGGLMGFDGSLNQKYSAASGSTIQVPTEWQSPAKYQYKLRGWYDVTNNVYYAPGESVQVNGNMVLYADWIPASYDIGQYNSHVANTVSTKKFVTTHVFDYNSLFNVMSEQATVSVNSSRHSETWNMVTGTGKVPYKNIQTLDFIFADWDSSGKLSRPSGINDKNNYNTNSNTKGIYNNTLGDILFSTQNAWDPETKQGIIGKSYLGTGDHLFQIVTDPDDEHYGYYYYDSTLNSTAYNQSNGRFYVYEYLERTSDSAAADDDWKYSDFLPLNSPYKNTNGKSLKNYSYGGVNGEYDAVSHYQYDGKYNTDGNSTANIGTNYAFGMSIDIEFYLPNDPGTVDANKDLYGKDMNFKFSGDDDVWIFVDGKLVLDIGDIHGVRHGSINFSTGRVTCDNTTTSLSGVSAGEHTLTIYYLERGSSQSNCAIYFNLAPRFQLDITKEDVLSQKLLDGAEFAVYTDEACTKPAVLWESEQAHDEKKSSTNTFKFVDGKSSLWGFGAGNKYYLKETKPPNEVVGDTNNDDKYLLSKGIICIEFDKSGLASSKVSVIKENGVISNGFTVHGFEINEEKHQASIIVTNAPDWVIETTTVQVIKIWNDNKNHSKDYVTAYLTVTDPDGTVRRIREIILGQENDWNYTWTGLPKYAEDGVTEIQYGTVETFTSGYYSEVERVNENVSLEVTWADAYTFENEKIYLLKVGNSYLSTVSENSDTLRWVDEATAKNSSLAKWTAVTNGTEVRLTNEAGQTLSYVYHYWHYFNVSNGTNANQTFKMRQTQNGVQLYHNVNQVDYYIGPLGSNGWMTIQELGWGGMLTFTPVVKTTNMVVEELADIAYTITNTPLDKATSFKVTKKWEYPAGAETFYEESQVTVKLFADGVDTGRTVTLNLKNGWTDTFKGLPYEDKNGNVISYTVQESWKTQDWVASYGKVVVVDGTIPTYETVVTNVYQWLSGAELPATGGMGYHINLLIGLVLILMPFIYGFGLRRRYKKT